jgi:predicted TPR repeat methyltransferase
MPANFTGKTEAKFNRAMQCHRNGEQVLAKKLYRSVLKSHPDHPGALHLLGLLSYQQGDGEAALRLMRSAVHQQPNYLDALNNLGNVLLEHKEFEEAEQCYRKVLELKPEYVAAYSNLCVIFRKQNRLPEAIEAGCRAVQIDPQHAVAWHNLGNSYDKAKKYARAIESYDKAIRADPAFVVSHDAFCRLTLQEESKRFFGRKKRKKTIRAYERWLECLPDTPVAKFMLQSLLGKEDIARMPDEVVREMFDTFASSFEKRLGELQYRVPGLIAPVLQTLLGDPKNDLQALDAGCGTGLCGPAIRPYAANLTGVDLSPLMLKKAKDAAIYDELVDAELGSYLEKKPASFDLIVSGDTLIYFGSLEGVMHAAGKALRQGGLFLFSLEKSPFTGDSKGYHLHAKGRYVHSADYVNRVLVKAGFSSIEMKDEVLRQEFSNPVAGLLVSARKK